MMYVHDSEFREFPAYDTRHWSYFMESARFICHTYVESQPTILVSTSFLGVDHNLLREGPPVLWETMVFKDHKVLDDYTKRYTSHHDAVIGHSETVNIVKERLEQIKGEQS